MMDALHDGMHVLDPTILLAGIGFAPTSQHRLGCSHPKTAHPKLKQARVRRPQQACHLFSQNFVQIGAAKPVPICGLEEAGSRKE